MNEGCTACACGVPGACDKLYFPAFLWPGAVALLLLLLAVVLLKHKKILKAPLKALVVGWLVAVLLFAGVVYLKTETSGERTQRAAEQCRTSSNPACEY